MPHAELAIAGSICEALSGHKDVVLMGMLDDLSTAYESAAIVVNPMQFGTGLKIKSLEAMSYSKPLVTTPTATFLGMVSYSFQSLCSSLPNRSARDNASRSCFFFLFDDVRRLGRCGQFSLSLNRFDSGDQALMAT